MRGFERMRVVWLAGAAWLGLVGAGLWAEPAATLSGAVRARDGARLPGATIEIRNLESGAALRVASGELGVFRASELSPGRYELRAELTGFEPGVLSGIALGPGETRSVDVTLEVATLREVVTVIGPAPRDSLEASQIREAAARDVGEALAVTPGVWGLRKGGIANDVVLRGLQSRDLNVLIDGQRVYGACPNHMDPPSFHVDLSEVERVEVGKGPFDLRNQGSLGGTVNVVTRRPEAGWHARANLAAGAFSFWNPSAAASYGGAALSALAGFSYRASHPYEDGSGRPVTAAANYRPEARESDGFRAGTGWARLAWKPASAHTLQLSYTRQQADRVLYPYLLMDAVYDDTDRAQLRYDAAGLSGLVSGLSAQAYWTQVEHWMTDELRTSPAATPRAYSMGTMATTRTSGARLEAKLRDVTLGLEAYERLWDATTELAGMNYQPQSSIPDVAVTALGAYVEYARRLGGRYDLTAGARLDRARSAADAAKAPTDLYFAYHGTRATESTDTLPSATLRLGYRTAGGLTASAGVGHTARLPEPTERYLALRRMGSDWVGDPGLEPSHNTGLDASLAYERRGLYASASLFLNRFDGFITVEEVKRLQPVAGVMNSRARTFANVDATLRGGELAAVVSLTRRLFVSTDVSYVRGTQPGGDLAEMPPLRGRAGLRFDTGRLFALAEGIFVTNQDRVDHGLLEEPTPGYRLANLKLGLRRGRLSLVAGVENLFDRTYVEHLSYQRDPFRSGVRVPGPGRNLYLNVTGGF